MKKVSIVIPVYKDGYVEEIVSTILSDGYPNKEIIICASQPSHSLRQKLNRLKKRNIKVIVYEERRGKVNEVNEVVSKLNTDILVFLDADLEIKQINLEKIVEYCEKYDLVEFYKEVKPICFLGKLMKVEMMGYYACYQYISSKVKQSIFLNGGGFAIRKELWDKLGGYRRFIIEDVDLAIRVYESGGTYHLTEDIVLELYPICSLRKWFDQRKRWASGFVEIIIEKYKQIIDYFVKHPLVLIFYTIIVNPAIFVFFLLFTLLPQKVLYSISTNILINLASKISPILLFVLSISVINSIVYAILFFIITNIFIVLFYEIFYYKVRKRFVNPFWILLYSILYSPLFLLVVLGVLIYYLIFEKFPHFNWKV